MKRLSFLVYLFKQLKQLFKKHKWIWIILGAGTIIRVVLNSAVDSFDFYAFVMWAKYLSIHRMADVFEYLPEGYTPYPPLYYYVLKLIGLFINFLGLWENKWLTYLIVRAPMIAGDILVTILIYRFTNRFLTRNAALWGAGFFFLHPATIYNTSVWGQIDSIVTLLGLLSVLAFTANSPFWGTGIFVIGVITKLQILALLPLIIFSALVQMSIKKLSKTLFVCLMVTVLPFLPIVSAKGIKWTWDYFFTIPNWYAYTSIYTYNLWAPFGFILSDNTKLLNLIEFKWIGIGLFWFVAYLILRPLMNSKNRKPLVIMFAAFLLWYDFSFFATRIHSRYLIYSFGFFAPFFLKFPKLGIALSLLMFANFILPSKLPLLLHLVAVLNNPGVTWLFVLFGFGLFVIAYDAYRKILIRT